MNYFIPKCLCLHWNEVFTHHLNKRSIQTDAMTVDHCVHFCLCICQGMLYLLFRLYLSLRV